jgi:hypothetical protein
MPKAVANISSLSPYHNLSTGDLADQLGAVKAEIAALEEREKNLRHELIGRGVPEAQGSQFSACVQEGIRWSLNIPTVRSEMGETWFNARCRQSAVTTVTVKPLAASAMPAQLAA